MWRLLMMGKRELLPTIWEILDDLWDQINPVILEMDPPKSTGRELIDPRRMLDGIFFQMRISCNGTGCPRN